MKSHLQTALPKAALERNEEDKNSAADGRLKSTRSMCFFCFEVLINALRFGQQLVDGKRKQIMPEFVSDLPDVSVESPIFITWEKVGDGFNKKWQLRGCIGNLGPRLLMDAVGEYALISALKDRRFRPITIQEISSLRVSVSLLVQYEQCTDAFDWTVGQHGIMIKFFVDGRSYSATFLPEVAAEREWTVDQTIAHLVQKAGYYGALTPEFLRSIQCTRYQSSKCRLTFQEYVDEHCNGVNPLSSPLPQLNQDAAKSWQSCKQM